MQHSLSQPLEFAPPPGPRWGGPMVWALLIHGLLVLALTWGITWKQDVQVAVEAELWSKLPQVAAPRANEPDTPPPAPTPTPKPPVKAPVETPPPAATTPQKTPADIALDKKRKQEDERRREEALQRQREAETQKKAELKKQQEQQKQREAQDLAEKKKREQAAKDKALAEQKKKDDAQRKADEAQLEADRKKNLARMMGLAGATGGNTAKGKDLQTSGPSASYAGKLVARIKPNIVFTDSAPGNPRTEVEVRTLPDGTIIGRKITKPSGHDGWDEAVLRAIDRTATLPKDENGKVPGTLILGFRPLD